MKIKERAHAMFSLIRDYLLEEAEPSFELQESYRFSYLVLRGPRAFRDAFEQGELSLDETAINRVYWQFQRDLPGPHGLMPEEEQIIQVHNREVERLKQQLQHQPPLQLLKLQQQPRRYQ